MSIADDIRVYHNPAEPVRLEPVDEAGFPPERFDIEGIAEAVQGKPGQYEIRTTPEEARVRREALTWPRTPVNSLEESKTFRMIADLDKPGGFEEPVEIKPVRFKTEVVCVDIETRQAEDRWHRMREYCEKDVEYFAMDFAKIEERIVAHLEAKHEAALSMALRGEMVNHGAVTGRWVPDRYVKE